MNKKKLDFTGKVELYEAINNIFGSVFAEVQTMAKKKPEATLSKLKVEQLNRVLSDIRLIFDNSHQLKYLDLLDDDNIPQFSDALLILAHYDGALKSFKNKHWLIRHGKFQWEES